MRIFQLQLLLICVFISISVSLQAQVEIKPDSSTFQSKVTINNTLENNGLKYPATDGTNGQVLTTDGTGNLSWQDGTTDFSSFYDYVCTTVTDFQIDVNSSSSADCGRLFDSGGTAGNYGNDENESFTISGEAFSQSDVLYTRVILNSLDIEENMDTLFIGEKAFFTNINTPDTLLFDGDLSVAITFKSNSSNPGGPYDGFEIIWESFKFQGGSSVNSSMLGFFFNAEKRAIGGGVEQDSAWNKIGELAVLFGYGSIASEDNAIAIGSYNEANGFANIALGYENVTNSSSSSTAIGRSNEATGSNSSAIGYFNDATGSSSTAFGRSNKADNTAACAFGYTNVATGRNSSAFGRSNDATGSNSSAFGYFNDATGSNSSALGYFTLSDVYQMMAVGSCNADPSGSATSWVATDPVFMIGNGQSSSSRSTAVTVLKNGNVGIGTSNPQAKLQITGNANVLNLEGSDHAFMQFFPQGFGNGRKAYLGFGTANSEDFDIVNEGTAADADINITSQDDITITAEGDDVVLVAEDDISFQTGGTNDRLRITQDGKVGVGKINPQSQLDILSNISDIAMFNSTSNSGGITVESDINQYLRFVNTGTGAGDTDFQLTNTAGGLTFNYSSSDFNLNSQVLGSFNGTGTYRFTVFGSAFASGGNFVNSDKRLKKNVRPVKNSLAKILQLEPKLYEFDYSNHRFSYLNLPKESQFGFLAQDVELLFPSLVNTGLSSNEAKNEDKLQKIEDLKSINYAGFVPLLVNSIQEQQEIIEAKEERIAELENKVSEIDELKAELASIKKLLSQNQFGTTETNILLQGKDKAYLKQNAPNPFHENTVIEYYLPESASQAYLRITDQNGLVLKHVQLEQTGQGQVNLTAKELPSGTYTYTLILDGEVLVSKQMVLTDY